MSTRKVNEGVYGPGTFTDAEEASLPNECYRLLKYMAKITPGFVRNEADLDSVTFHGHDLPIVPGPLKSQAMSAVLNAMIGIVGRDICSIRGFETGKIDIDVDKAGLYPETPALVSVSGKGLAEIQKDGTLLKAGKDVDGQILTKNAMHYRTWAIFPTKYPKVWYQLLGNLDPAGFLRAYGLDPEAPVSTRDEAYELIKSVTVKYSAAELDMINMEHGFCGQTCYTPAQWRTTQMAKRLREHPVIDVERKREASDLPSIPFPSSQDPRPLAGIKIVELARVIAGPAMGSALAAFGADVIKVFSPNLHELQRTCALDLTVQEDKEKLQSLIDEADVVVQAFRQGPLERKGFGLDAVLEMDTRRKKGIVYVDLNCYGPDGYYAERPGFQQIADAASGCSYVVGKSLGLPEGTAVLPPLPIADMLSGAVSVIDIMLALRARALEGGSYHACVALTSVDTIQLEREVGLYPPETVKRIQERYNFAKMAPDLHVEELLYVLGDAWTKNSDLMTRKGYMVNVPKTAWGENHSILSSIVKFENYAASPRWDHGPVPYFLHKDTTWS